MVRCSGVPQCLACRDDSELVGPGEPGRLPAVKKIEGVIAAHLRADMRGKGRDIKDIHRPDAASTFPERRGKRRDVLSRCAEDAESGYGNAGCKHDGPDGGTAMVLNGMGDFTRIAVKRQIVFGDVQG
jgi:hypothetical protein